MTLNHVLAIMVLGAAVALVVFSGLLAGFVYRNRTQILLAERAKGGNTY